MIKKEVSFSKFQSYVNQSKSIRYTRQHLNLYVNMSIDHVLLRICTDGVGF